MSAEDVAREHYRERKSLSGSLGRLVRRLWGAIDPGDLDGAWARAVPALTLGLVGAQLVAARLADAYVTGVLDEQGIDPGGDEIIPDAFAGVASDGRDLEGLLRNPITVVKAGIAGGATVDQAMAAGYANLDMLVRTQLADAGRAADQAALVARPAVTGYVRMLVGESCSRCVILAGRTYRWNAGFLRHPSCDCIHVPAAEDSADDVRTDPRAYFDSLTEAQQDKAFTKAGAQAIRDGADMAKTVNARRGMQTATVYGRQVLATTEAAGRRVRLMPEQIYLEAAGDRDEAVRLLKLHGYIRRTAPQTSRPLPVRPEAPAVPLVRTFDQRAAAAASGQEALDAATFGLGRNPRPAAFTPAMSSALNTYTGAEYNAVNRLLRGQPLPYGYRPTDVEQTIADLDVAMAASRLSRDVLVHRGLVAAGSLFGDRMAADLSGMEWTESAYVSTTARRRLAVSFAGGEGSVLMRILVPAGTPAVQASTMPVEAELVLRRGLRLRVVADRGIDPDGVRHIDVEVIRG